MSKILPYFLALGLMISIKASASLGDSSQNLDAGNRIRFGAGKSVEAAPAFVKPMQCIVKWLGIYGYKPKNIGCLGARPHNRSAHPTAHACDVDQTSRDVADVNKKVSATQQSALALRCNAVSGCSWGNRDCGHFEARGKVGYVDPGTRPRMPGRTHRYSKNG